MVRRTVSAAAVAGFRDYAAIFSWKSWLLGWYLRVLAQVIFFALIGKLLGSEARTHYLLIGNAVLVAANTSFVGIVGATADMRYGTMPLIAASPAPALATFAGRSLYVIGDALATGFGAILIVGALFGLPLPGAETLLVALPLVAVSLSAYLFSVLLAGLILDRVALRNLVSNVAIFTMALLCGVNVTVASLPQPLRIVADCLPVTHGLVALRQLLAGDSFTVVIPQLAAELGVAAASLVAGLIVFNRFLEQARARATLDFA